MNQDPLDDLLTIFIKQESTYNVNINGVIDNFKTIRFIVDTFNTYLFKLK
jgi:hypothetical protein